jgi:non-ribosomal peptide synthetase component F
LEADSLRDLAKGKGATLFSVLLAAFRTALFRWTGEKDVVVGTPVAGRGKTAARETMGYFSGNVPLRGQVDPGQSFEALLVRLHREVVDDFAHAMPFAELAAAVGASPAGGRHPVFDVRFAVQNHPFPGVDIPGISSRLELVSTGTARFDIGCEITEDGRKLEVVWLHRTDVLTRDDVSEIDRIFRGVIGEAGRNPSVRPVDIKL